MNFKYTLAFTLLIFCALVIVGVLMYRAHDTDVYFAESAESFESSL